MNFKSIIKSLALFVLFFCINVNAYSESSISFIVHYPKSKTMKVSSLKDVISEDEWSEEIQIEEGKVYKCAWNMLYPKLVKFTHDDRSYEFYVEPNDSLFLEIDGVQFPNNMTIEGRGQVQNLLLYNIQQPFSLIGHKQILSKLYTSKSIDYRAYIDDIYTKKWTVANQLFNYFHGQYSNEFHQYVESKINYWRAYYLMEFYNQHKTSYSNIIYEVTDEYYNFLDDVYINNESAMEIDYFRSFLKIYWDFRVRKIDFKYGIPSRQRLMEVAIDEIPLFENESCKKMVAALPQGTKVLLTDALSYGNASATTSNIYLIKVKSMDQRVGWCKLAGLAAVNQTHSVSEEISITRFNKNFKSNASTMTLVADELSMFADPDDQLFSAIKTLKLGDQVIPMNEKTSKRYDIRENGVSMWTEFIKVRASDGTLGWVNPLRFNDRQVPIRFEEKLYNLTQSYPTYFNGLEYFYTGNVLAFLATQDLRNQILLSGKSNITKKYNFIKRMKIDRDIKYAIETYINGTEKKYFVDSTDYDTKYSYDQFVKIELRTEKAEEFDQQTLPIANANSNENIDKRLETFHTKMKIVSAEINMQGLPNKQKTEYAIAMRNKVLQDIKRLDLLMGDAAKVEESQASSDAPKPQNLPTKSEKEVEKKVFEKSTGMK